jgi:hypothetical protein
MRVTKTKEIKKYEEKNMMECEEITPQLDKRMRPKPPNLSKTPARIIDPKVGAST